MKSTNAGASEGVIVFILGVILGMLLAFVMVEYGNREVEKASNNIQSPFQPPPSPTNPPSMIDGNFMNRKQSS